MKKLFLFILMVLGLSSCTGWYNTSSSYQSDYFDYRNPNYRPYGFWTDVVYTPYYSRYYSNYYFGYSSYYGFYSYYQPYDYYNYYGLYNHNYHRHFNYNNYSYTYPKKKVINKPVYRRSRTIVSSKVYKPKTYPRRRNVTPNTNGRNTNRYTSPPTKQRTNSRPVVKPTQRRTYTPTQKYRSNTAVQRNRQPVTQRSTTVRPAPSRSRSTSTPIRKTTPTRRKN